MLSFFCRTLTACFLLTIITLVPTFADAEITAGSATCYVESTNKNYPCHVGKNGILVNKKEGDGATPAGNFPIREIFYRPDKLSKNQIARLEAMRENGLFVHALTPDDGWSDDVRSLFYNQHISIAEYLKTPIASPSYEKLWREDDVYNIIVVIGYNDQPVIKGKGSAIFMHLQRHAANGQVMPTIGCVSFAQTDLIDVIMALTPQTLIHIPAQGSMIRVSK